MVFCKKVKALSHRASARKKRALCLGINAYGVILYKDTNSSRKYLNRLDLIYKVLHAAFSAPVVSRQA